MGMTLQERATQLEIYKYLKQQGYRRYAEIFAKFDFNFYDDGEHFMAAMEPGKYRILYNPRITSLPSASVLVRHEILHEYLKHMRRLVFNTAKKQGIAVEDLTDQSLKDLKRLGTRGRIDNIAGDYEISNRGYTDADKVLVKHIELDGEIISGLITEEHHKSWENLSFEEMCDKLNEMYDQFYDALDTFKNNYGDNVAVGTWRSPELKDMVFSDGLTHKNYATKRGQQLVDIINAQLMMRKLNKLKNQFGG